MMLFFAMIQILVKMPMLYALRLLKTLVPVFSSAKPMTTRASATLKALWKIALVCVSPKTLAPVDAQPG
jgi:hypothetical protein